MTTILNGLLGGFVIGVVAVIVTRLVANEPPATGAVLESVLGVDASSSRLVEFLIPLVYGTLAGGTLVALELFVLGILAVPPTTVEALGVAVVWGALLFGTLSIILRVASPRSFTDTNLRNLLVYHLVYGLGLGVWIRMTWIT